MAGGGVLHSRCQPATLGYLTFLAFTATLPPHAHTYMECNVKMCGVLTLSTGLGRGEYQSDTAMIHGLWPQVDQFGNSACLRPTTSSAELPYRPDEPELLQCYDHPPGHEMSQHEHWFVNHEWDKHGKCSGVSDVNAYVAVTCGLAKAPLDVMNARRRQTGSAATTNDIADALRSAGYPVRDTVGGDKQEVHLSACAGDSGTWKLAEYRDFQTVCSTGGDSPPPSSLSGGQCVAYQRGPECSKGDSCSQYAGCLRCASSGYCTDVALSSGGQCVAMKKGPECSGDADCTSLSGCVRCAASGYCTDVPLSGPSAPPGGTSGASVTSLRGALSAMSVLLTVAICAFLLALGW